MIPSAIRAVLICGLLTSVLGAGHVMAFEPNPGHNDVGPSAATGKPIDALGRIRLPGDAVSGALEENRRRLSNGRQRAGAVPT